MPVSSRVEVAAAGSSSIVPGIDQGCRRAAHRGSSETFQGAGAKIGFVKVAEVKVGQVVFGGPKLVLIAGPCVIESADSCLSHADRIAEIARRAGFPYVFKSS